MALSDSDKRRLRIETLREACQYALLKFKPTTESTFCNVSVNYISQKMGFDGFRGMMANDIVHRMNNAPDFSVVGPEAAQALANDGRLVIAGITGDPEQNGQLGHGHVSICYVGDTVYSGKWKEECPQTCNVGKENKFCSSNYGFNSKPKYYAWIS